MLVIVVGLPLELAAFLTANYLVARPRPSVPKLGDQPGTYSYPSGHIAATIVLWGAVAVLLVWHYRERRWLAPVVTAVVVSWPAWWGSPGSTGGCTTSWTSSPARCSASAALAIAVAVARLIASRAPATGRGDRRDHRRGGRAPRQDASAAGWTSSAARLAHARHRTPLVRGAPRARRPRSTSERPWPRAPTRCWCGAATGWCSAASTRWPARGRGRASCRPAPPTCWRRTSASRTISPRRCRHRARTAPRRTLDVGTRQRRALRRHGRHRLRRPHDPRRRRGA